MTFEEAIQVLKENGLAAMAEGASEENSARIITEAERVLYYKENPMPPIV